MKKDERMVVTYVKGVHDVMHDGVHDGMHDGVHCRVTERVMSA